MIFGILLVQGFIYLSNALERKRVYAQASNYAKALGKPLIVVGGSYGNLSNIFDLNIPFHGAGDVCIDIDENACRNENFIQADITNIPLPDKYGGAVFCSHVLEHLPTVDHAILAITELDRIADKAFILVPQKTSLLSWINPSHHLWIYNKGNDIVIEQFR